MVIRKIVRLCVLSGILCCFPLQAFAQAAECTTENQALYDQCLADCDAGFPECVAEEVPVDQAFIAHIQDLSNQCAEGQTDLERRDVNRYRQIVKALVKLGLLDRDEGRTLSQELKDCKPNKQNRDNNKNKSNKGRQKKQ